MARISSLSASRLPQNLNETRERFANLIEQSKGFSVQNYGLEEKKLNDEDNRKIIQMIKDLGFENLDEKDFVYFDSKPPEKYLENLRHSTQKDKYWAKDYESGEGGSIAYKSDFDKRVRIFIDQAQLKEFSEKYGTPESVIRIFVIVHELVHKLIYGRLSDTRDAVHTGALDELIADRIALKLIEPQKPKDPNCPLLLLMRLKTTMFREFEPRYFVLEQTAEQTIEQVLLDIDDKFDYESFRQDFNKILRPLEKEKSGNDKEAYMGALTKFFNRQVENRNKKAPESVLKLVDMIAEKYAVNIKSTVDTLLAERKKK